MSLYQAVQCAFAAFVAALIAERVRALFMRALTSEEGMRFVLDAVEGADAAKAHRWAELAADSFVSRVLMAARVSPSEVSECLLDLREEAGERLRLLRVCATLASTLGLLGGILALARSAPHSADLLRPGGIASEGLGEAITTMAIGVATSAFCFQALALLRPAAQRAFAQAQQVASATAIGGRAR